MEPWEQPSIVTQMLVACNRPARGNQRSFSVSRTGGPKRRSSQTRHATFHPRISRKSQKRRVLSAFASSRLRVKQPYKSPSSDRFKVARSAKQ